MVLVKYFTTLLDNPAISGLAPMIPWYLLNPNDPGPDPLHPASGAYVWNALDDVFIAVDQWNDAHHGLPPKTIQLIISPGYNSPGWVFGNIDASVCGWKTDCANAGSCDGLFMAPPAAVSRQCGYTTLFFQVESGTPTQEQFPLPWNFVYKNDWQKFLVALNQRIRQEPSSSAFNTITVAGPSASSTEMILPNDASQKPYTCGGDLSLMETLTTNAQGNPVPVCPLTQPGFDVASAWNKLFGNYYGPDPRYQNSDLAFIEEFDAAIDLYGRIFSGVTLALTTTTDALPTFYPAATDPSLYIPAPGFESDCGNDPNTNPAPDWSDAMACAAVTQVLAHYTNPLVGGNNGKLVFEAGMTAARDGIDLGTNGVKWLSATTAGGSAPLPGTPFRMSRIIGGVQFAHTFSKPADLQAEGCPDYTLLNSTPMDCMDLTASQGLANVLSLSYFPGTAVGPFFCASTPGYGCASTSVQKSGGADGNFVYNDAPLNFLQIYDDDILYASGLSKCKMIDITGSPASPGNPAIPPDVSACQAQSPSVLYTDAQATQTELNLTTQKLLSIAEPTGSW